MDRNDTVQIVIVKMHASLSVRRAWIEIGDYVQYNYNNKSLSVRRAWIEIHWIISRMGGQSWSLSVRRAWIEIGVVYTDLNSS